MVNKKISGQTITIIILSTMLLVAITFGGVYAFYSAKSNKMTGVIVMANLHIDLISNEYGTDESTKSEIVISHGTNFVAGQPLKNSSLKIVNKSKAPIYLVVVYELNANKIDNEGNIIPGAIIEDKMTEPVIDLDTAYINGEKKYEGNNSDWIDFVFTYSGDEGEKKYRCLVSTASYDTPKDSETIVVIKEDSLRLHKYMGNEYQQTSLSFAFQAYAIGSQSYDLQFEESVSQEERCNAIVGAIYESVEHRFFEGTVNISGDEE